MLLEEALGVALGVFLILLSVAVGGFFYGLIGGPVGPKDMQAVVVLCTVGGILAGGIIIAESYPLRRNRRAS